MTDETATAESDSKLQKLLARHLEVLNEHAQVISSVLNERAHQRDTSMRRLVQACVKNTKTMIKQCEEATATLLRHSPTSPTARSVKRHSEELEGQPISKKTKQEPQKYNSNDSNVTGIPTNGTFAPPVSDASGLFAIDSNPTPIEELLKNSQKTNTAQTSKRQPPNKRRRSSQDQAAPVQPTTHTTEDNTTATKRKKTKHTQSNDQNQAPAAEPEKDEDEAYAEAFEQKVALRLKEKDEAQKKKANKKRKRESNVSATSDHKEGVRTDPINPGLAQHLEPTLKPSKRRKQALKAESAVTDGSQTGASVKDTTKVQNESKSSKKKRKKSS